MPLVICGALLFPAGAHAAGTVTGTITPVEWAQEVEVCVVEQRPSETCSVAGADGSYVLREVPFGGARIEFVPSNRSRLLAQYYDHKSRLSEAATIFLTSVISKATGVNADLVEGGAIEGIVTAAGSGLPLAEVEVCAVSASSPTVKRCEETNTSGAYELHSLPTGTYRVAFRGQGKSDEYQPQYYDHKQASAQANLVAVSAGEATANVDAALDKGARIEGGVTDVEGAPLPGMAVCLFDAVASTADLCTDSDEAGSYAFKGLPSGSYEVGFSLDSGVLGNEGGVESDGFQSQYFDGVGSRAEATTISAPAPTVVTGVNASLSPLSQPSPPPSLPVVGSQIVAAPPVIPEPKPKAKRCKKGFLKKKVTGKVRCVKKHKKPRHRRRKEGEKK